MTTTTQYRAELDTLLKQNESLSNEVLVNRHREVKTHLNEIQASINLLAHDCPDIVVFDRRHGGGASGNSNDDEEEENDKNSDSDGTVVNFECFKEKVASLNALRSSQMATYLERDSMDNFLRYVVKSSTGSLPVSSLDDPVFLQLTREVNVLESQKLPEVENEIESIKLKSSNLSQEIFEKDCMTKEICAEVAEELDSCFALLDELSELQAQIKKQGENSLKVELENAQEAYSQLTRVRSLEEERLELQRELDRYSKREIDGVDDSNNDNIPDTIRFNTLKFLSKLLEANLDPGFNSVSDLNVDSARSIVTFKIHRSIPVEINLDGSNDNDNSSTYSISGISIGSSLEHAMLAKELLQNFSGSSNVFAVIRIIVNKLS